MHGMGNIIQTLIGKLLYKRLNYHNQPIIKQVIDWMPASEKWKNIHQQITAFVEKHSKKEIDIDEPIKFDAKMDLLINVLDDMQQFVLHYDKAIQDNNDLEHFDLALFVHNVQYIQKLFNLSYKYYNNNQYDHQDLLNLEKEGKLLYEVNVIAGEKLWV